MLEWYGRTDACSGPGRSAVPRMAARPIHLIAHLIAHSRTSSLDNPHDNPHGDTQTPMLPGAAAEGGHAHGDGQQASYGAVLDPGWLYVLVGIALLGASILIPAADSLAEARYLRDRALAIEAHRLERMKNYEDFLEGIHAQDPKLALSLAATQLNQIPVDRSPLPGEWASGNPDASVFPALEPGPLKIADRRPVDSILERLVTGPRTSLWVTIAGAALVLFGVLPRASRPISGHISGQ